MQMLGSKDGGGSGGASYDGGMDQGGAPDDMNQAHARQANTSGASGASNSSPVSSSANQGAKPAGNFDDFEDDIPF